MFGELVSWQPFFERNCSQVFAGENDADKFTRAVAFILCHCLPSIVGVEHGGFAVQMGCYRFCFMRSPVVRCSDSVVVQVGTISWRTVLFIADRRRSQRKASQTLQMSKTTKMTKTTSALNKLCKNIFKRIPHDMNQTFLHHMTKPVFAHFSTFCMFPCCGPSRLPTVSMTTPETKNKETFGFAE